MTTFLGLLELVVWIAAVVVLAAGVTWVVMKLFPARDERPAKDATGDSTS